MKMSKESYAIITETFKENEEAIRDYSKKLKEKGDYQVFETRLSFDVLRGLLGSKWICSMYREENLNDSHILTASRKALKEMNVI